jgi:phage head maturation protease
MKQKRTLDQKYYRDVAIDPSSIDTKNRTIPVSFSSDEGVMRFDWWEGTSYNEILGHAPGNVDLTRLSDIGVSLFNHDPNQVIGKVLNPAIDSKAMRGTANIQFDTDEASDIIYQKVLSGTLKGVSVGYRVTVWETVDDGETSTCGLYEGPCQIARMWEPFEISIVSVPADATVGVGRSMNDDITQIVQRAVNKALALVRGVVPDNISTVKADEGTTWKAPALKDFTKKAWGDLTDTEKSDIAGHFAWAAEDPPDTFGDLKLPHHQASDGKVVWDGVSNAGDRIDQTDIPSGDLDKVKEHLAAHYKQFGKTAPWDEPEGDKGEKSAGGTSKRDPDGSGNDDIDDDETVGDGEPDDDPDDNPDEKNKQNKKAGGKKSMPIDEKEKIAIREEAAKNERVRTGEIRAMFKHFAGQVDIKEEDYIDAGTSVDATREAIMKNIIERSVPAVPATPNPDITVGADDEDKFRAAATDALCWRSGMKFDEAKAAPGFKALRGINMIDLGREVYERQTGKRFKSHDRNLLVREMVQSSVFSYILQNVADKSMQNAYQYAPVTYPIWTKHGVLNDYKPALRAQLSEVPLLSNVSKGEEYKLVTLTDAGEWIQLSKRGNLFTITREDIINDDMHALVDFPARWATAARETINSDVYSVLNGNPNMGYDGNPLFYGSHKNLEATNKTAPSKLSLQSGIQSMMLQTGLKTSIPLNIRPKFLLSPVALMWGAKQLLNSAADNTQANSAVVNVLENIVTLVTDPLLDLNSPSSWYLAADPAVTDTVEVGFLNGQDTPYIEQQAGFQVDGFTYKIRIEYGVKALDWRGLFKNPGQ